MPWGFLLDEFGCLSYSLILYPCSAKLCSHVCDSKFTGANCILLKWDTYWSEACIHLDFLNRWYRNFSGLMRNRKMPMPLIDWACPDTEIGERNLSHWTEISLIYWTVHLKNMHIINKLVLRIFKKPVSFLRIKAHNNQSKSAFIFSHVALHTGGVGHRHFSLFFYLCLKNLNYKLK